MKAWCLKLLIRLLVRYLDVPQADRDKQTDDFMAGAWMSPGFRKYIAERDVRIIYHLAGGDGMKEPSSADYIRYFGQRVENLLMGRRAKDAYTRKEKERAQKLSTPEPPVESSA